MFFTVCVVLLLVHFVINYIVNITFSLLAVKYSRHLLLRDILYLFIFHPWS